MTVGVALSSTPPGLAALRLAVTEAVRRDTELVVLAVVDTPEHATDDAMAKERYEGVAAQIAEAGAPAELSWRISVAATRGNLAEALLDLATAASVDPLVIGTRRRTPVGKLIMGSTVQRVLLEASMGVLVTKA